MGWGRPWLHVLRRWPGPAFAQPESFSLSAGAPKAPEACMLGSALLETKWPVEVRSELVELG